MSTVSDRPVNFYFSGIYRDKEGKKKNKREKTVEWSRLKTRGKGKTDKTKRWFVGEKGQKDFSTRRRNVELGRDIRE